MLIEGISRSSIEAIAEVIVSAVVDDGECDADVEVGAETKVCNDCVGRGRRCGGSGIDKVKGCCDEGYSCYKRSSFSSFMTCASDSSHFADSWTKVDCEN